MDSSPRREASPPTLTSEQVRAVDRLVAERYAIPVQWLMEAAGWQVARHCRARTAVVAGRGQNGGDALAAARHLHRWGRLHSIACIDRQGLVGPAAAEAAALEAAGVEIAGEPRLAGAQLALDGLLGTGLRDRPRDPAAGWIRAVNASGLRVVAVDLPSGLDADGGTVHDPCVRADVTVSLGLAKRGLLVGDGPAVAGELWLADIGVPFAAYEAVTGRAVPAHLFTMHDRVQPGGLRL